MKPRLPVCNRGAPTKLIEQRRTRSGRKQNAPLTPAMQLFIARYMVRHNATRAYMESHPAASYSTASCEGSKLMADPRIAKEIRGLVVEAKQRLKHSASRALDELSALAFSSLSDAYDGTGAIASPSDLPRDVAVAVKKIKRTEIFGPLDEETGQRKVIGHTVEIEMHDKVAALRLLAQHYGLLVERVRVLDRTEFASLLKEGRERASGTS